MNVFSKLNIFKKKAPREICIHDNPLLCLTCERGKQVRIGEIQTKHENFIGGFRIALHSIKTNYNGQDKEKINQLIKALNIKIYCTLDRGDRFR